MASNITVGDMSWIKEGLRLGFAYRNGFAPIFLASEVVQKLPFHPWYRHPGLMEVADDYMLQVIDNRLKKVWKWSAEKEKAWDNQHSLRAMLENRKLVGQIA